MTITTLEKVLKILRQQIKKWKVPVVGVIAEQSVNRPFEVLVSTVLSLRTKDAVTMAASQKLLALATTPAQLLKLTALDIEKLIYPVGFYKTKAKSLLKMCQMLIDRHGGGVPDQLEELLELPGVGRKTANLVLTVGFGLYGICVDTHVHRISNRWGLLKTDSPDESEMALRVKLPRKHWKTYNDILVTFGQNLCVPISPHCSQCFVKSLCPQIGVLKSR